jgi:hypothetical protein
MLFPSDPNWSFNQERETTEATEMLLEASVPSIPCFPWFPWFPGFQLALAIGGFIAC